MSTAGNPPGHSERLRDRQAHAAALTALTELELRLRERRYTAEKERTAARHRQVIASEAYWAGYADGLTNAVTQLVAVQTALELVLPTGQLDWKGGAEAN